MLNYRNPSLHIWTRVGNEVFEETKFQIDYNVAQAHFNRQITDEEFVNAVATLGPKRVVYVSCGPDTLARDLVWFKKKGYQAETAWAVDMFPMTAHAECVVKLTKVR